MRTGESSTGHPRAPLLALQILRFAAAAMVLVHHAGYDADLLAARTGRAPLALDSLFDWTFGIHLFFVLSGFIMVHAERDFGRHGAGRRFLLRRVIRVVPLYWLLTTALLVGTVLAPNLLNTPVEGWRNILGSYLFVPVMRATGDSHPVLGQGWTLNYEMLFYLVFAAGMILPRRWGLLAIAGVLLSLVGFGWAYPPHNAALQVWTDPILIEFLFGGTVALARDAGPRLGWVPSLLLGGVGWAVALCAGPAFPVLSGPGWLTEGGAAALILAGLALGPSWPSIRPVLVLSLLGDASYSLYLAHPFMIRPLRELWRVAVPSVPVAGYAATACVAAIVGSLVLHVVVEAPLTLRLRRSSQAGAASRGPLAGAGITASS